MDRARRGSARTKSTDNKKPARGGFTGGESSPNMRGHCPENVLAEDQDNCHGHQIPAKSLTALGCGGRI